MHTHTLIPSPQSQVKSKNEKEIFDEKEQSGKMSIYRVSGWTDGLRSQQCPAWGREGQVHIGPSRACSASAGPLEVQAWLLHCAFTVGPEVALGHRVSTCMVRSEGTVGSGM